MTAKTWKRTVRFILASQAIGLFFLSMGPRSKPFATSPLTVLKPHLKEGATFRDLRAEAERRDLPFKEGKCPYPMCGAIPLGDSAERRWLHLHFDSDGKLKAVLILNEAGEVAERLPLGNRN